jgi:hypothetical protein
MLHGAVDGIEGTCRYGTQPKVSTGTSLGKRTGCTL